MIPTLAELSSALIAVFEGPERLEPFRDAGGVWTAGRGHTGRDVIPGTTISHEQSVAWFAADQAHLLVMVAGKPLLAAAALVDFGYNCGVGALHAVLTGADTIANPRHTTDRGGAVESGLVSRRRLEGLLIASADTT